MKSFRIFLLSSVFLWVPALAFADCLSAGYTVIFVNGIQTTQEQALDDLKKIQAQLGLVLNGQSVTARLGYNATHLAGLGDKIESVTQAFNAPISDYDLKTILMQIYPQVTTRKILLVGHSQGTFYTNELYKYLTTHGVPKQSIGVYNIATPASYVEGGGGYVTSTNDKLINYVRTNEINGDLRVYADSYYTTGSVVASALRANITVTPEDGYDNNPYGGHLLSVYLDGAAPRIMHDINAALGRLEATDTAVDGEGCFVPPNEDLSYKAKALAFAVADPLAQGAAILANSTQTGAVAFTDYVANGLADTGHLAQALFSKMASSNTSSSAQAAAASLAMPQITTVSVPTAPKVVDTPVSKSETVVAAPVTPNIPPSNSPVSKAVIPTSNPMPAQNPTPASIPTLSPTQALFSVTPGFGGGGGGANTVQSQSQVASTPVPVTINLTVSSPEDNTIVATSTLLMTGTATSNAVVSVTIGSSNATTSADGAGNWSIAAVLPEGASAVSFKAVDTDGHESSTVTRNVTVDTIPPAAPTATVAECSVSIVASMCAIPTAQATLSWPAVSDAAFYGIAANGTVLATTTALTSSQTVSTSATTTFAVVAYDAAGNAATSTDIDLIGLSHPLIINEIGWAGDDTNAADQWIELKNTSPYTLDLSNVTLTRSGGSSATLSGTIPPVSGNFAVIEPTNIQFTGSNKIITPFAPLSTASAEQLALAWNTSTTLDSTPVASTCASWCAGSLSKALGSNVTGVNDLYSPLSMERVSDLSDGLLASSWHDTDSYGPWLGSGTAKWGTPGAENSSGLPDNGVYCGSASNLITSDKPYNPSGDCVYLSRFVTGDTNGALRNVGLYRGTVSSSTSVTGHSAGKALALATNDTVPADAVAGERFFFAIWEVRNWNSAGDVSDFNTFFTTGALPAPHGNYVTIPFTYQP